MQNIVIDKPYVPVPPYHGRIWTSILTRCVPRLLRAKYWITRVECLHVERLRKSIQAGHGIMLTPNHSRDDDPPTLGMLSLAANTPFFLMASWHLFMQSRLQAFILRRVGAFSIYREGIDRSAVNTAVDIVASAARPLVIFPEGIVSRTNDRLNPLLEGIALIARAAAKRRAKLTPPGKVVVHPVALRYRLDAKIEQVVAPVLDDIETKLTWQPDPAMPLFDRIQRIGTALVTLKELEYIGHQQNGSVNDRLRNLIDAILTPLENEWLNERQSDTVPIRVKRLRQAILPDMVKGDIDEPERQRRWKQLAAVYLAQALGNFPPDYVRSNPTPERILETVERFEEGLNDKVDPHGPLHVTITVGEAIEVNPTRENRGSADPLLQQVEAQLRAMLGIETT